jgi:uncharacterized delta-60 repeat protein
MERRRTVCGQRSTLVNCVQERCVSNSIHRRRRWRTLAATLALTLGSLAIPAAALADGQLDPSFDFVGAHAGSAAEGTLFTNTENRVPMVVQTDGKIVVGGSSSFNGSNYMTLTRYTVAGNLDPTFGTGGIVRQQFIGTPGGAPGNSGAVAMTLDAAGNIDVAGFGGSQSMVAARFSTTGALTSSDVCYAPHLIDYTARALVVRTDGRVVLVGYARDRFTLTPTLYGLRAVVALGNGTAAAPNTNANGCGTYSDRPNPDVPGASLSNGSNGVAIDGLTDVIGTPSLTDPAAALGGRFYEGVVALANNTYVVASTVGPDGTSWVQRFTATNGGAAGPGVLDATFNATGAVPGRTIVNGFNLHALAFSRAPADGSVFAAGETTGATADTEMMGVVRIDTNGTIGGYGSAGVATSLVAGGADSGQALVVDPTNRITVGGGANLAGKTAFGLTRFTPTGARDNTFGAADIAAGQTVTSFGAPPINAYITGIGLTAVGNNPAAGAFIAVSGRVTDPNGLLSVAARYYATGTPPPPLPPAATTLSADQVTMTSARINGSVNTNGVASNWWIEYGTTAAYGSQTVAQPLAPGISDIGEQTVLSGLATGTVYHARLVMQSAGGTTAGNDVAFTTLGVPAPPGSTGGTTGGTTATGGSTATGGTTTTVKKVAKKASKLVCLVPKVTGKKLNAARRTVYAKGCKVQLKYVASTKPHNTVLAQSRKAGKKLGYRSVVKLTIATKASAVAASKKS